VTALPVNLIPAGLLNRLGADQVVLLCNEDLDGRVLGTTDFDPASLREIDGLESLSDLRRQEDVYSITTTVMRLTPSVIRDATDKFDHRERIASELQALLDREEQVYVVYVVTHFNHKPAEEMTVFIGGDCYRTGPEIKDLESVLTRTKNLAQAMIRKAVLVFPDIPTLHGGKKGEWIILDRSGSKIKGISDEAIIALGTLLIPTGIRFLNRYKEKRAIEKGIYGSFPAQNSIRPDTASPDVLSGPNWKTMCDVWAKRGVDLSFVTCLPSHLNGPIVPSAHPTGYGVVATALKLVDHRLGGTARRNARFLLEALGGVGRATIEALIHEKGISPDQITAFDKSPEACKLVSDQFGVKTTAMPSSSFYEALDPDKQQFDVWINNGEGDNTRPEHIQKLIDCGVRVFCGAANNFLKLTDDESHSHDHLKRESLQKIFDAGGWAWPDEAASGGGWTLAVVDVLTRAKGEASSTEAAKRQILETIIARNEMLVDAVVGEVTAGGKVDGEAVWHSVEQIINERVQATLRRDVPPGDILAAADVTRWKLA
jgi:hypothetical protein